jgi:hypothetical protein
MIKLTLDKCMVYYKIRRRGEEDEAFAIPTDQEVLNHPENLTFAVEVSYGGFHATSKRVGYLQGLKDKKILEDSTLIWLVKDMRATRDMLLKLDLLNEFIED